MNPLQRLTTALAVLVLLATGAAFAQDDAAEGDAGENPVVIRAGDTEVTLEEFDTRFEIALRGLAAQQGLPLSDDLRTQLAPLAPQFLQQRASEIALLEAARERGIEATEEEVDARVEEIRATAPDEEGFQNLLQSSGIGDVETLRALLREDLIIGKLQTEIEGEQSVSEEDLRAEYEADPSRFEVGEQVCASHILVETEEEANQVLEQIESGEITFAEAAGEYGTDATNTRGGELGCFGRGQMVEGFENAVFDPEATIDEPFGPVETEFGHHIIMVTDRQEAQTRAFEDVREELEASVIESAVQEELMAILENTEVETFPERLPQPETPQAPAQPAPEGGAAPAQPDAPQAPAQPAPEGEAAPAQPEEAPAPVEPEGEDGAENEPAPEAAPETDEEPAQPEGEAAD